MEKRTMQDPSKDATDQQPHANDVPAVTIKLKVYQALLKIAGQQIDPESAEVEWTYGLTLDPYGVWPDIPEELRQVGREYFARVSGTDVWVNFGDLPEATRDALWKKHRSKLAFPAGLEGLFDSKDK
jgi:hypothetical protein